MSFFERDKYKIIISDLHLGRGPRLPNGRRNYLEDFFHDRQFSEFLEHYRTGPYKGAEVELIINGDFFNHVQVDPDEHDPIYVNEHVALARTNAIMDGHPEAMDALKEFASAPHHSITYVVGNHDFGLFFPSVKKLVEERIGGRTHIFGKARYITDGVCIEHGNRCKFDNYMDPEDPFVISSRGEKIVRMPWGHLFLVQFVNKVRRERTYVNKIYPFKNYIVWGLLHDTFFALRMLFTMVGYFLKALFGLGEYRCFKPLNTWKIIKEFSLFPNLTRAAKKMLAEHPECQVVVLGHGHSSAQIQFDDGREYLNAGTWNEMVSLDIGNFGTNVKLTFVEIGYDKANDPLPQLKEWHGRYREVEDVV